MPTWHEQATVNISVSLNNKEFVMSKEVAQAHRTKSGEFVGFENIQGSINIGWNL